MIAAPRGGSGDGLDADIVIVGAGAAGLAAASRLRARGFTTVVLEASSRPGGRARTSRPGFLAGGWIDEGAAWLHAPDQNPLVELARRAGEPLRSAFGGREMRLFVDGREADAGERAAYEAAEQTWQETVRAHLSDPTEPSVAEAVGMRRFDDPWAASIENWECAIIAAADADQLGLRDWERNQLPEGDLIAERGFGRLLLALLLEPAGPVRLETTVTAIDRTAADRIEVTVGAGAGARADAGTIRAAAAIVTVSTGVLGAGTIRFDPALPATHCAAIERLPMGLLSRIVLRLREDRLDPELDGALLEHQIRHPGQPALAFGARPRSTDQMVGFVGGRAAWSLAADPRAAEDFARSELGAMLGHDILDDLVPGAWATEWGTDPNFRGAYSYAGPGAHELRAALGEPIDDARLVIAGEACRTDGLAGTVGGAVLDGWRAADLVAGTLEERFPRLGRSV